MSLTKRQLGLRVGSENVTARIKGITLIPRSCHGRQAGRNTSHAANVLPACTDQVKEAVIRIRVSRNGTITGPLLRPAVSAVSGLGAREKEKISRVPSFHHGTAAGRNTSHAVNVLPGRTVRVKEAVIRIRVS